MPFEHVGRCTGVVLAVRNADEAERFWSDRLGFARAPSGTSLAHPETGQDITLIELRRADPAMSVAVRCDDVDVALGEMRSGGFEEYWREDAESGTRFVMCRDDMGVFVLLYQEPSG